MLQPPSATTPEHVGDHYDRLAPLYLHLWGNCLHHGLWDRHSPASISEGTTRLLDLLAAPLSLNPGSRVIDIGCGYGSDAHRLAGEHGALVTGLTVSRSQAASAAENRPPSRGKVRVLHGDWLENDFAPQSFEAALAIESLDHMPDKPAFFGELARTLITGGRAALSCWTAAPAPTVPESLLLDYLCQAGALSSIETLQYYRRLATKAGLAVLATQDLTTRVAPTWWHIARRGLASTTNPRFLRHLFPIVLRRPALPGAIPAMMLAYRTGILQYQAIWLGKKPS